MKRPDPTFPLLTSKCPFSSPPNPTARSLPSYSLFIPPQLPRTSFSSFPLPCRSTRHRFHRLNGPASDDSDFSGSPLLSIPEPFPFPTHVFIPLGSNFTGLPPLLRLTTDSFLCIPKRFVVDKRGLPIYGPFRVGRFRVLLTFRLKGWLNSLRSLFSSLRPLNWPSSCEIWYE